MSIVLQEAGQFIESDEKVYFAHNFALYFYKIANEGENITNSFKYISEEEYENKKANNLEFMLYECNPNLIENTYNLENTNIVLPPEAVDDCIEKFHQLFADAVKTADSIKELVNDPQKLKEIPEEELSNIINGDSN